MPSMSRHPARSVETRSAPAFSRCYPRSFAFYLGKPISSIQATGPSVSQPFGLSTALVRNWSSLFLNRMLCETFSLLVRSGMENVSSCARMKGWRRLWNWKRRFIVSSHRHKAPPAQAPRCSTQRAGIAPPHAAGEGLSGATSDGEFGFISGPAAFVGGVPLTRAMNPWAMPEAST